MKNIRLFFSALCVVTLGAFNAAKADDVDAPGKVKLKIETKSLTKEDANTIISSGGKVSLGVYLVLDAGWQNAINQGKVRVSESRMSFAFFNTKDYYSGDYFNNSTADYITICGSDNKYPAPSWGCSQVSSAAADWYTTVTWYTFGTWPTYSYGGGFTGGVIFPTMPYFKTVDGNFEIKLFDLQFELKQATRDIPVGFVDNLDVMDGSSGNTELNVMTPDLDAYRPHGIIATDWTDSRIGNNFAFENGGIFFETGPEAETFEPSFIPLVCFKSIV